MLFAATRAPSGSNRQPFRFLVLTDGPVARRGEGADRARARARPGARSATRDGYDRGSGADDDPPQGADGAHDAGATSTSSNDVPVLILPCLVRYRAPEPFEGASVYPACPEPAARGARPRVRRGADDLARARRGRSSTSCSPSPTACSSPRPSRSDGPRGRHGPVRRRPIGELVFEDRWGETPARGPSTRPARGTPRPDRRCPRSRPQKGSRHDVGLLDRARVPGEARLDRRVRARPRSSRSTSRSARHVYDKTHPVHREVIRPLQEQVKKQDLWACHLGPDLGGLGYGQVKLALMNEILGRSTLGADRCSAARPPTPATPRSSPTTARQEQKEQVPPAAARRRDRLVLLDDRAAGRRRPAGVHLPGRAGRRRVGHQRREVVLVEPALRRVRDRDGRHRPRRADLPGRVDVPRARPTRPASRSSATPASPARRSARDRTRTCATTTCASRRRTCSAARARRS